MAALASEDSTSSSPFILRRPRHHPSRLRQFLRDHQLLLDHAYDELGLSTDPAGHRVRSPCFYLFTARRRNSRLFLSRPKSYSLWRLDPSRESAPSAERLLLAFSRRRAEADEYNARLAAGDVKPPVFKRAKWALSKGQRSDKEQEWRIKDGKKKASLAWSLNEGVALFFWTGGLFKVVGDTAQLMSPLVTRQIILFAQERARHTADPEQFAQPHIGRGVGMALGLFFLTIMASVCQHQFFWRSMSVGVTTRARLTTCIYRICAFRFPVFLSRSLR